MLAVLDTEFCMLKMVGVGRRDIDDVHIRVVYQFFIGTVGFLETVFFGECRSFFQISGSDGEACRFRHGTDGFRHPGRNVSGSDDSDVHGHKSSPPLM